MFEFTGSVNHRSTLLTWRYCLTPYSSSLSLLYVTRTFYLVHAIRRPHVLPHPLTFNCSSRQTKKCQTFLRRVYSLITHALTRLRRITWAYVEEGGSRGGGGGASRQSCVDLTTDFCVSKNYQKLHHFNKNSSWELRQQFQPVINEK